MEIELEISRLASDGRGIGFCEGNMPGLADLAGMAVFARGGLPGQRLVVVLERVKKNYAEGVAVCIIRDNPDLLPPFCSMQGKCGGCPLQRLPYPVQLSAKMEFAKDALKKFSGLDREFVDAIFEAPLPSPTLQGCRNKIEFAFGDANTAGSGGKILLGQRAPGGVQVVPLAECPLLPTPHAEILSAMVEAANMAKLPAWQAGHKRGGTRGKGFWRHFTLRIDEKGKCRAICGTSAGAARERRKTCAIAEKMLADLPNLSGFIHEEYSTDDLWRHGGKRIFALGDSTIEQNIGGRTFRLDASSFAQVNPQAANLLASLVQEMTEGCENGRLLDLYCGIGAPGLLLASRFGELVGVESQEKAISFARENAESENCHYLAASAEKFLEREGGSWHTVLADPPRSGLGPKVVRNLVRLKPRQIVYISCNPATFARDAAILGKLYRLARLASVDMFPHTPHLECASRWILRDDI